MAWIVTMADKGDNASSSHSRSAQQSEPDVEVLDDNAEDGARNQQRARRQSQQQQRQRQQQGDGDGRGDVTPNRTRVARSASVRTHSTHPPTHWL